ncbi:protein STICHEL [Ziziphus jujuba]|uniref:Protein STICHEL n=1 Tax=Ziziphus jujuba TaxID=326968 RepID=A0ABM3IT39_ZIZJJ|nr:protein STICHEL [Ziziphus jujuba]XP_048334947.2 protein STICHEL [Ziziphus jujuba]
MSEMRVSHPSKFHLKKELTQIRKAARVLRDPGTTSSWRSPLASSRSAVVALAAAAAASTPCSWKNNNNNNSENEGRKELHEGSLVDPVNKISSGDVKDKRVFLSNWMNPKSSSEKSLTLIGKNDDFDDDDDDDDDDDEHDDIQGSSSIAGASLDDSLSDARNVRHGDTKSDTYLGDGPSSMLFRRRDANLVSLGATSIKRTAGMKKRCKKIDTHLDVLSKYQQKEIILARNNLVNSRRLLDGHPSVTIGLGQDDSVEQSDDTEEYCNSEDIRPITGASPLLWKLKHKNWSHSSSKFLRHTRREDSSYTYSTPALSTSSYNRYGNRNPSTVGSWDGTTTSMNDGDDEVDDHLDFPGRQGCGIPCYWSKRTPKHRGMCRSCYSPSLSDTLRRKGSSIFCGSHTMYTRRRRSSLSSSKRRMALRSAQGVLPLLTNSGDGGGGSSIGTGRSDDELSTNFGELDLEALSRLDGRRWSSSCRSQEGLEIVALKGEGEEEGTLENIRSFSQKYKPMFFGELIGQSIVVQSLINAISRYRIAPVYLFQGPRGTGKTSAARIFASALNCLAPNETTKPCGYCRECADFISGKSRDLLEVDGTNKKGIDRIRCLLKSLLAGPSLPSSRYKVFVIDECHLLPSKTWLAFLKFLEEPPQRVVFIFITTDLDNVPRTIQSRCQKYLFNKIKDSEIVARLRKISAQENLDAESDALDLIALNADGSLRDAETMLEQLSLLGERISTSLVNELVGVVSDEKLLELLELAMSSDTAETVKRARELMDSGVDPMVLMTQLASLIMDIIAGTDNIIDVKHNSLLGGRYLTEAEVERLKHALKLLSESEKQLRISSERSTWFTATLLQLGSLPSPDLTLSGSSRRQSSKTTDYDPSSASREATSYKHRLDAQYVAQTSPAVQKSINCNPNRQGELSRNDGFGFSSKLSHGQLMDDGVSVASHDDVVVGNMRCTNLEKLDNIWAQCIERCHSKTLRQLLDAHGKLVSIAQVEGILIAYVAFTDENIKSRAERFLSSITNSIEMVLRCNIEVRIIHLPGGEASLNAANLLELPEDLKQAETRLAIEKERKEASSNKMDGYSNSYPLLDGTYQSTSGSSELLAEGNARTNDKRERRQEIPMQRIESIIREQRLETAWLQAAEKGTPESLSRLRPDKNQVLPQEAIYCEDQMDSKDSTSLSPQQWEDELNHEHKVLKLNNGKVLQKDQIARRVDRYPMSPSLLHDTSFMGTSGKDNLGYESGSGAGGCSGFFCWNTAKTHRNAKVRGTPVRPQKVGRFSLFGECVKSKKVESRHRR